MPAENVYFEEGTADKPYSLRLLGRLTPFLRPYRLMLTGSILLVLTLTFMDLALPYLTKIAIDRYIVPAPPQVSHANGSSAADPEGGLWLDLQNPAVREIVARHPQVFHIRNAKAFIAYRDLKHLPLEDRLRLRRSDLAGVLGVTLIYLLLILLDFALDFLQRLVMEYAGHRIMHDLRMRLFRRLQDLSLAFFARQPVGRLVTRATNDVQNMHELFTSVLSMFFQDFFLLAGISAMLLSLNWQLALAAFAVLPLVILASGWFARRVRHVFRQLRIKIAQINTHFAETVGGIQVIQAFGRERDNSARFDRVNHENYLAGMAQIHLLAVFMPLVEVMSVTTVAVVIWYGGGRIVAGEMTLGVLVAFISYLRMFFRPIRDLSEKFNILQDALASAERLFLLMDSREELPRPPAGATAADADPGPLRRITFQDVDFAYTTGEPVLQAINFTLQAGETIALVGPTGSGKTSLTHLVQRFYLPTRGEIRINGRRIHDLDPDRIRARMALVTQDPFLFSGTVRSNIFPDPDKVSAAAIDQVLAAANCQELVARLPQGLDTVLREGGASLSSGERQLLSIARAFARRAELIILDEATSYIDSDSEKRIQSALERLMAHRTAIVVAHRLSTVRHADRILVLHRGRLLESGSHLELLARRGFYRRLHDCQLLA